MPDQARAIKDLLVKWRRTIHMNPELGFEEFKTSELVAENLKSFGLKVQKIARTGVMGILGEGKPAIGLRADMDCLPLQEENQVDYASQVPNKMHACGHDAHVAMLLGAAKLLSEMPDRPKGEIRFLFQPSEERSDSEGVSGGNLIVKEGLIDPLDHVFAIHINSTLPVGKLLIGSGFVMAAPDEFEATITGKGTHGAYPHMGVDPIFALAQVINAIQGIRARRINPLRPSVISIGSIRSGDANNIVPNTVFLNGTIRSYDEETHQQLHEELERAFGVARALGCQVDLKITRGYPATYNDPQFSALVEQAAKKVMGADCVAPFEASMAGEDFSYLAKEKPGTLVWLGARLPGDERPHHNPHFDIDEDGMVLGAGLYVQVAVDALKR